MSIYNDNLTNEVVAKSVVLVKKAFPSLPINFFDVFSDRIICNKFTDKRLNDAVNHVIDTCIYPTPTIANFISFDKFVKLYTYDQVVKMSDTYRTPFDTFKSVRIGNLTKPMYCHFSDIEKYKIELWNK